MPEKFEDFEYLVDFILNIDEKECDNVEEKEYFKDYTILKFIRLCCFEEYSIASYLLNIKESELPNLAGYKDIDNPNQKIVSLAKTYLIKKDFILSKRSLIKEMYTIFKHCLDIDETKKLTICKGGLNEINKKTS